MTYATSEDYAADTETPLTDNERVEMLARHSQGYIRQGGKVMVWEDDQMTIISDMNRQQLLEWLGY